MSKESLQATAKRYQQTLGNPDAERYLKATLAGPRGSYPAEQEAILEMVREQFIHGVGALHESASLAEKKSLPGIVVPHLDFRVGGPTYSYAYRALLDAEPPELYVILGVGHRSRCELSATSKGYQTALGTVECDTDFIHELAQGAKTHKLDLLRDARAYNGEHSIEFVVIYLQAFARLYPEYAGFEIAPVLCGGMHQELENGTTEGSPYHALVAGVQQALASTKKRVCFIASIDGAHVGPRFQHPFPVDKALLKKIRAADLDAWDAVATGSAETFFETFLSTQNARYFDGVGVLWTLLTLFQNQYPFSLLHYDQWFTESDASVVTLASGMWQHSLSRSE